MRFQILATILSFPMNKTSNRISATALGLIFTLCSCFYLLAAEGNALALNGVSSYASAGDNNTLDLGTVDGQGFTIEASFYVPDLKGEGLQTLIYKQSAYALFINFHTNQADQLFFRLWSPGLPTPGYITLFPTASNLSVGWHHAAAVFDNQPGSGSDVGAIYLDGTRIGLGTGLSFNPGIGNSASALYIGAYLGVNPFHGWIDEARLSDVVSYSGASYTVPTGAFVSDANTRALWHFDETAGSTSFADASGNGNTLTGINAAVTGSPPGDPTLSIGISTNNILISWPNWAEGYALEGTTNLSPPFNWLAVTNTPFTAGNQETVTLSNSGTNTFFRLKKP